MSQAPLERSADGSDFDTALDRWGRFIERGHSHSGRERNVCFLNTGGGRFANVSAISGLDFPDDSRGVGLVDWDHDGRLDVWMSNRSAPMVRFLRNAAGDRNHFVSLRLRGTNSNRDGIGARVSVHLSQPAGQVLMRTLHAGDGFLSQGSRWLHFGLGPGGQVDHVEVRWPGGATETFTGIEANGRYGLLEGSGQALRSQVPPREVALAPGELPAKPLAMAGRRWLAARAPLPEVPFRGMDGRLRNLDAFASRPLWVLLWTSSCPQCRAELATVAQHAAQLRAAGVTVVALCVDEWAAADAPPDSAAAVLSQVQFPFLAGWATTEAVHKLELLYGRLFGRETPLPLPGSVLVDPEGWVAAIYFGPLPAAQLVSDVHNLPAEGRDRRRLGDPFPGRWHMEPAEAKLSLLASGYAAAGYDQEARRTLQAAVRRGTSDAEVYRLLGAYLAEQGDRGGAEAAYRQAVALAGDDAPSRYALALLHIEQADFAAALPLLREAADLNPQQIEYRVALAKVLAAQGQLDEARQAIQPLAAEHPDSFEVHAALGLILAQSGQWAEAAGQYRRAIELQGDDAAARHDFGLVLVQQGRLEAALEQYQQALRLDPNNADVHNSLGLALVRADQLDAARRHFTRAVHLRPTHAEAQLNLGLTLRKAGRLREAVQHYQLALRARPGWPLAANSLAWILATASDPALRDPPRALELAEAASRATEHRLPEVLDTLAAAYAATGRFSAAVDTAEKALALCRQGGRQTLVEELQQRLAGYRRGEAFVEPADTAAADSGDRG